MFMPDQGCPIRILTVLKLSWNRAVRTTGPRAFHALSFKQQGRSVYLSGGRVLADADTNDILFCPKGIGYTQRHDQSTVIVVHFDCPGDEIQKTFEVFKVASPDTYRALFERMYDEWNGKLKGCELKATSTFYEILYRLRQESMRPEPADPHATCPTDIDAITVHIDRNLSKPELSVASLAERYGCSESYLRRIFVRKTGLSPRQYITQMRLSLAKSLLRTGYFNVTETALKCGFTSQKHFSTAFMNAFGISPSDYMRSHSAATSEV